MPSTSRVAKTGRRSGTSRTGATVNLRVGGSLDRGEVDGRQRESMRPRRGIRLREEDARDPHGGPRLLGWLVFGLEAICWAAAGIGRSASTVTAHAASLNLRPEGPV